jgi:hypothetical protein
MSSPALLHLLVQRAKRQPGAPDEPSLAYANASWSVRCAASARSWDAT